MGDGPQLRGILRPAQGPSLCLGLWCCWGCSRDPLCAAETPWELSHGRAVPGCWVPVCVSSVPIHHGAVCV